MHHLLKTSLSVHWISSVFVRKNFVRCSLILLVMHVAGVLYRKKEMFQHELDLHVTAA